MMRTSRKTRPLILAHRGFHRRARENTRQAIVAARDVGADGVEFDVRTTIDGAHVLHHNRTRLFRGRQRPIAALERRRLPAWVPDLATILRRVERWQDFVVNVELKDPHVSEGILELLTKVPKKRLVVTSFHLPVCRTVAEKLPGVRVGWILERPRPSDALRAHRAGCRILVAHRRALTPTLARSTKRHRLALWTWGINTSRRARAALQLGVKAIITDRPDVLLRADLTPPARPRMSRRRDRRGS